MLGCRRRKELTILSHTRVTKYVQKMKFIWGLSSLPVTRKLRNQTGIASKRLCTFSNFIVNSEILKLR